jgi:anti-anti-sigma factor
LIELPYEKLTIYEVEEFYEFLINKMKDAEDKLELNFAGIEKIDMVAIQLLLSLQQTCKKNSISLIMRNFSSELMDTLKASGCHKILEVENG